MTPTFKTITMKVAALEPMVTPDREFPEVGGGFEIALACDGSCPRR
ncbi:MAG: hypothetical protein WAW17_07810 [Rhodococcus sp. (in: high G+C Gram-positive bacteria)]